MKGHYLDVVLRHDTWVTAKPPLYNHGVFCRRASPSSAAVLLSSAQAWENNTGYWNLPGPAGGRGARMLRVSTRV